MIPVIARALGLKVAKKTAKRQAAKKITSKTGQKASSKFIDFSLNKLFTKNGKKKENDTQKKRK